MKKILVIHNKYRLEGGEDIAIQNELKVLKKNFETHILYFDNEIESYIRQFFYFLFNKNNKSIKKILTTIESYNPDLIYLHNTWFKISPGIFKPLIKLNTPIFLKIHNFRFFCTRYILSSKHLEQGSECRCCGMQKKDVGIFNKYFLDSSLRSFFVLIYGRKYIKILNNNKINILVLTHFQKKFMKRIGIRNKNIFIHRNFLEAEDYTVNETTENYLTYAGRISTEKGVEELIKAFNNVSLDNLKLKILGDGPDFSRLSNIYKSENIEFLGQVSNLETLNIIKKSIAVVTATRLYEGQPTLLCEASILGIPAIFPENEGIQEFFPKDYDLTFDYKSQIDLENKLKLSSNKEKFKKIGLKNREHLIELINEKAYIENFKSIIN